MKKKIMIFGLLCLFACFSIGCSAVQSTLSCPSNVKINNGILTWNSVDGASGYYVYVDNDEYSGTSPFDLKTLNLVEGQVYTVSVKAKGDGYLKLTSDPSQGISYVALASTTSDDSSSGSSGYTPPEVVEEVTNESIANDLFEYGLGYGVNALTAKKAVGGVRSVSFFDESMLTADNLGSYQIGSSRSTATSKENISDEVSSINAKLVYGSSTSVSVLAGMFTAGFEEKFSLSTAVSSSNHVHQYYFIMNHYIVGKNYQIKNYQQPRAYSDKISEYAKEDIEKVRDGSLSAERFFDRYGTHLTMAVSYGGMTEVYYSTFSQQSIDSAEITSDLSMKLNAGLAYNGNSASISTELDEELDKKYNVDTQTKTTNLYIESIGKTPISSLTFENFASSYPNWVEKMDNEENYRIVDVADNGLCPIWDYFPDEYSDVAQILSNYFEEQATLKGEALAQKMTPPTVAQATTATITLDAKNCKNDNHYNTDEQDPNPTVRDEIDKNIFQLLINGTTKNNNKYKIVGDLKIDLKLIQDINNITLTHVQGSGLNSASISSDTWTGSVKNTTITGEKIGKGAVYVNVTYGDGTTEQRSKTNICDGKSINSCIDILDITQMSINETKTLISIEIVTVYEIKGLWGWGTTVTNWRTDTILYFE